MTAAIFVAVARSEELEEGAVLGVVAAGTRVCLLRHEGVVHAVDDECPHQGYPLSTGELLPGGRLECPWHGAQFDCRSGAVVQGPATDALVTWAVREADGRIELGARRPAE